MRTTIDELGWGLRLLLDQFLCWAGYHMEAEELVRYTRSLPNDYVVEKLEIHCLSCEKLLRWEHRTISFLEIVESLPLGAKAY